MIRLHRYDVPFRRPFRGAGFTLRRRQGLLLSWTEGSLTAWGEASPLPGFSTETLDDVVLVAQEILPRLGPLLSAGSPIRWTPESLPPGLPVSLKFALDTLRTDLLARRRGTAFHEALPDILGIALTSRDPAAEPGHAATTSPERPAANPQSPVSTVAHPLLQPPRVGVNAVLGLLDPGELLNAGLQLLDQGCRTLKIKVGDPTPILPSLRQLAADPRKPRLRFDANGSWPEEKAGVWADLLAELNPEYLEQPFPPGFESQMAHLQQNISFPLAADESVRDADAARRIVEAGAAQALILKPALIGSYTELLEIVLLARRARIKTVFTTLLDAGVARRAVASLAWALAEPDIDHGLSTGDLFEADPLPDGDLNQAGYFTLPQGAGIGNPSSPESIAAGGPTPHAPHEAKSVTSDTSQHSQASARADLNQDNPVLLRQDDVALTQQDIRRYAEDLVAEFFKQGESNPVLAIEGHQNLSTLRLIASCWLAEIPFTVVRSVNGLPRGPLSLINATHYVSIDGDNLATRPQIIAIDSHIPASGVPAGRPNAVWLTTSGSTGQPKMVPITRAQVMAAAHASAPLLKPGQGRSWLLQLPLNHAGGLGVVLRCLNWGATVRLVARDISTLAALRDFPDIDTVSLVPTQLHRMLEGDPEGLLARLKNILVGGGSLSQADLERVNSRRLPVRQSFGMTETFGHFCVTEKASMHPLFFCSAGKPLLGNEIQIRSEAGEILPPETPGLLWLRGPQVFSGYTGLDAQSGFDAGGWFFTGDYGQMDLEGNLIFEARRTDLVKTGGESVNTRRVEQAIEQLGLFREVAVLGLADPEWGQRIHACLVGASEEEMPLAELRDRLRDRLQPWELPKSLSWHPSLPRTELGKIHKASLVDLLSNP